MKKNLFLILLSLLTVTWSMGQKAPKKELFEEIDVTTTIDLTEFMTKQSVESSSIRGTLNEGFEDVAFPPTGWKVINDGDANGWERYSGTSPAPISGAASARIKYSSTAHDDWLITPPLLPVEGNDTISFRAKQHSYYIEEFNVKLSTTGNNKEDFNITLASNVGPASTTPETFEYVLSAYHGQTVYFAIQAISTDMYYLYVDDFVGPTIFIPPTDLVVTGGNKDYRLIPLSQLDNALTLRTNVKNVGTPLATDVTVTKTVKDTNNTTLFTASGILPAGLETGATETVLSATLVDLTSLTVGDYSFNHTANFAADYDPTDNSDSFNFSVTEDIYARDAGVFLGGVGGNSVFTFGNLFKIVNNTRISGVQFVWPATLASTTPTYRLALYKIDGSGAVLETVFTTETYQRVQSQQGQTMNIPVRPTDIQAGLYVLAVKQLTSTNIAMAFDKTPYGFMLYADNASEPTGFSVNANFGNLSLRMDLTPKRIVTFNIDSAGTTPLEGAIVTVKQGETVIGTAVSDTAGKVEIYALAGNYTYTVKKIGYVQHNDIPFEVSGDMAINVQMVVAPPALEVTPATFTYADTHIETSSAPQTFTLQSVGQGTVTVNPSDITIVGDNADQFTLTTIENAVTLDLGETATFTVAFTPTTVGEKTATIQVNDNLGKAIHSIVINGTAFDLTINEFPYTESFNEEVFPPLGWLSLGEYPWKRVTEGVNPACEPFGAGMLMYNCWSYSNGRQGTLITRRLDMGSGDYAVGFKMYRDGSQSSRTDKIDIYVNTQPNATDTTATLIGTVHRCMYFEPIVSGEGWYDYDFEIPAEYVDNFSYVIIVATSNYGANIFIDELVISETSEVTLVANPAEGGTVTGGGNHIPGMELIIKATANEGYKFINWTNEANEVVSTTEAFNYVVGDSDVTFTANFAQTYDIVFTVKDQNNVALSGVSVAYTGEYTNYPGLTTEGTVTTASSTGIAKVSLPNGTYNFTLTKADYYTVPQTVVVNNSGDSIDVQMQIFPEITFIVKNADNEPIPSATINLQGVPTLTTYATGDVTKRLAIGTYTGTVYKIGHHKLDVSITIADNTDTTFNFVLVSAPPTFAYTADWSEGVVFKSLINTTTPEVTFQFTNIGSDTLFVDMEDFSLAGGIFTFSEDYTGITHNLATGAVANVKVKFAATEVGSFAGQLIYVSGGDSTIVELLGIGYDAHTTPFVEDFESGSFETNNWFVVNGTQKNQWFVGTAADDTENLSAIVSNDGGLTNAYTMSGTGVSSTVHFYTDIAIPEGEAVGDVKLLFDWKGRGESSYDRLRVHVIEPTDVPVEGTQLSTSTQIGATNYSNKNTWQSEIIDFPVQHFGATKRLVFQWRNDGSVGTNPPAAVDNIILMSVVNIASVAEVSDIEVPYGTQLAEIELPDTLLVTFDKGYFGDTVRELPITWDTGTPVFDGMVLGDYQFTGTIQQLPQGVANPNNITATAIISVVKADPVVTVWPVAANAITYGTLLSEVVIDATEAETSVEGEFTYVDETVYPNVVAGGYEAAVKFTPDDIANYNVVYGTMLVDVNKYPINVIANDITKRFGTEYVFEGDEFTVAPPMLFTDYIGTVTLSSAGSSAAAEVNEDPGYDIIPSDAIGSGLDNYEITYVNGIMKVTDRILLSYPDLVIANKVYDKTVVATIASFGDIAGIVDTLSNVSIDTTNAVAQFTSAGVGNNKVVTITGLVITGPDSVNYVLGDIEGHADITHRPIAVINAVASDKVYDGTNAAVITGAELDNVIVGDVVTLSNATTGTFAQATIGTDIEVTTNMTVGGLDVANYLFAGQPELTADITAKELTIGGSFTASDKLYDGTTAAEINPAGLTLIGVVTNETVSLVDVVAEFDTPEPGDNKLVSIVSAGIEGETAGNYELSLEGAPTTTARIYQEFTLTLVANPVEGGTVNNVSGNYQPGANINLIASPAEGYRFINWTKGEEVVNTNTQFIYTMPSEDVTLTANFELIPFFTVTFTVKDAADAPIEGATVAINQQTLTTNATGVATIELENGTYAYTVSKEDYVDATGDAVVSGADLPVNVTLQDVIVAPHSVSAAVININQALVTWNTTPESFSDDIESYADFIIENIGNYTLVDVDGSHTYGATGVTFPNSGYTGTYIVFNPSAATPALTDAWAPHSGNKYLAAFAAVNHPNNDWLITHQVTVSPGMSFSFWARSYISDYGLDRFKVGVSTTGTTPSDFTFLTGSGYVQAPTAWTQYTYSLDAYAGQQVYLAINCVSDDSFILMVDDIFIGASKADDSKGFLGYTVYLNDEVKATGLTTTEYTITDIPVGTHNVGVQSVYTSGSSAIVYADPITVYPADFAVTFTVTSGEQPIEGAVVTVNSQEITTNASGVATINLANGEYDYTVSKLGYVDVTGSFEVNNAEVNEAVNMVLSPFAITFHAQCEGAPLQGVTILVGGKVATTNAQGNAIVQLVNGSYDYQAIKTGYNTVEGTFVVNNAAQTVTVNMSVGIDASLAETFVRLYPNPVESMLTIERNNNDEVVIELYNSNGALISTTKTESATTNMDVETLSSGSYFIRLIGTNRTTVHRFIKQ